VAVDTSAVIAVLFGEVDAELYADVLDKHAGLLVASEVTRFELSIVVEAQRGQSGVDDLHAVIKELDMAWAPVDASTTQTAIDAWRVFGKGRHSARLNLGDCFSYALAKQLSIPLLYKGDDFARTDIEAAV
jgi:ribonuclease VapC